ncbi:hypothetical protein VTJ83DRAFT_5654 [Remersonia thermophila]|uniref:Uncharacterized protein n=1 Tax=Remersonia thermophila TaxID=72144 RepID=A0ABR4D7F5_9PEZI
MRLLTARSVLSALVAAPLAASLFVSSSSSPCSKHCGNVQSSTASDEIVCDAGSLKKTPAGLVWEQCISCLLTSNHTEGGRSDMQSLLYNLRRNVQQCFFDGEANPCLTSTACHPFEDAVKYQNMTTDVGPYDYCRNWEQDMLQYCNPCLVSLNDGILLHNYMQILQAACEQTPEPGRTVSIRGNPFGQERIEIVPPEENLETVPEPDYGPVSLGARVGIAFGGLAFILAVAGFCIVCNGKRRRRAFLRELQRRNSSGNQVWPHPKTRYGGLVGSRGVGSGGSDMFETPVSQRPLRGWDNESPVSANTDATFQRYFSPYNSQYNSPVTGPGGTSPGTSSNPWPTIESHQQLQQLPQQQMGQSPTMTSPPPPAFTQWPTAGQEKLLAQANAAHDVQQQQQQQQQQQRKIQLAIGLALGGDEASLRSKASSANMRGGEAYELHEVESPYGSGKDGKNNSNNSSQAGVQQYDHYRNQAPVLQHPGYGRNGSRPGSSGSGKG